jgi:hypothetical protein
MQKNSFKLLALASALALVTFSTGCSDDESTEDTDGGGSSSDRDVRNGGGGNDDSDTTSGLDVTIGEGEDAGTGSPDSNTGGADTGGGNLEEICELLTLSPLAGESCDPTSADACDENSICVTITPESGDVYSQCSSICLENLCPDVCEPGALCRTVPSRPIGGGEPAPQPVDVDDDGNPDDDLGACIQPPTGSRQPYQSCGDSGACVADATCLVAAASGSSESNGVCGANCTQPTDCPTLTGGSAPQCVPIADTGISACVIQCSTTAPVVECPAGYSCSPFGTFEVCVQEP